MESLEVSKIRFVEVFREKGLMLFTSGDVKKVFGIKSGDTLGHLLRRLKASNVIRSLIKDKYLFLHGKREVGDFETVNFLVSPSYISLETALSYYSLIDQFPYRVTSITVLKGREIETEGKVFAYAKIRPEYFCDFVRVDSFLIATKEKALFDYLYFIYKGLRPANILKDLKKYFKNESIRRYFYSLADGNFKKFLRKAF